MTFSDPPPVLSLRDVHYTWAGQGRFRLHVPALTLAPQETLLLLGESGSGKSTLLSLVCGTVLAQHGVVAVNGTDLGSLSGAGRDRFRAEQIGVIFQQFNLLPFGTVRDNILLPLRFAPERRSRVSDPVAQAADLCAGLNLPTSLMLTRAGTLSVGQQQRVAVARAMIGQPPLIIADEPTSALDANSQTAFLDLMFGQVRANQAALMMVSHDPRLADRFDRVLRIEDIATTAREAA